jgi:hypothetical protein
MKAWLGKFIHSCMRSYDNMMHENEPLRSLPRSARSLEERMDGNMPALIAFRIENGFIVDTVSGMRYCKDANEIAEAIVAAQVKEKMGLKGSGTLTMRESNVAVVGNGSF